MKDQKKEIDGLRQALLKANQDIERLSKVKTEFIAIISHELRTPLTSIKEGLALVLDDVSGPINTDQRNFLNIAKKNVDRLEDMITNILELTILESGSSAIYKRKMSINELIKEVYSSTSDNAEKANVRFEMELSDEVDMAWFDPNRMRQVLRNLISNAIKFNKPNGNIKISSKNDNIDGKNVIRISIQDTGTGISEDKISELFKAFNPLDSSMTRCYSGMGLGLAICKHIIELHGGEIWLETKKGVGTKFIFTLPITKESNRQGGKKWLRKEF